MTGHTTPDREPPPDRRPWPAFIHNSDVVVVPAAVCAFLVLHGDLARLRIRARGDDPATDAVLVALTVAGNRWRTSAAPSVRGSALAVEAEPASPSAYMSTGQAADALNLTQRGVRLACTEGRIPATRIDGRWQLDPAAVATYRRNRAAA